MSQHLMGSIHGPCGQGVEADTVEEREFQDSLPRRSWQHLRRKIKVVHRLFQRV